MAPNHDSHYTYMLLCNNGSIYTGYTRNLQRRLEEHNSGKGAKYTKAHRPVTLLYAKEMATRSEGLQLEARLKKQTRQDKISFLQSKGVTTLTNQQKGLIEWLPNQKMTLKTNGVEKEAR